MSGTMSHADKRSPPPVGPPSVHPHHDHSAHHRPPGGSSGGDHSAHAHMVDDFRRRFWVSLALTLPVLATSEMVPHLLGLRGGLVFPGDRYVAFGFASAVYLYGGGAFLTRFFGGPPARVPGVRAPVAVAVNRAYPRNRPVLRGPPPGGVFLG